MNIYEVNIKDLTAIVAADSADKAIECLVEESHETNRPVEEYDLNYVRQLACEEQPEYGRAKSPKHLIVDPSACEYQLKALGYEVIYKGKKE